MKKSVRTKQDIKRDLLCVLQKRKFIAAWLTVFLCITVLSYISYAVLYTNGIYLPPGKLTSVSPTAVVLIVPFLILILAGFLLYYYYIRLFKIKRGKFDIIKEELSHKERELKRYYRRTEKENVLYFGCGRIAVENKVYSYSNAGDSFYLIILKSENVPFLVYHTKYYEIDDTV